MGASTELTFRHEIQNVIQNVIQNATEVLFFKLLQMVFMTLKAKIRLLRSTSQVSLHAQ